MQACSDIAIFVANFFENPSVSTTLDDKFFSILDTCNAADPIGNSAYVIEYDDHSGSVGPEMALLNEPLYSAWAARSEVTDPEEIDSLIHPFEGFETLNALYGRGAPFKYWSDWFEGFLEGRPVDWELQRRVAHIDNAIWETGPEAVAQEIERIRAGYDLEKRIEELEAELRRATFDRHGIGGNMSPETLDDKHSANGLSVIRKPVKSLKDEIAKVPANPERLQKIIEELIAVLKTGFAWCRKKGDLMVDTTIKWAIPAGGTAYVALNPDRLEAVIESAKELLNFL